MELLKAEAFAIQSSTSKAYVLSLPASRLTVEVADLVVVVAIPTLEVTLLVEVILVSGAVDVKVELDVVRELVKLELELEAMNVTFKIFISISVCKTSRRRMLKLSLDGTVTVPSSAVTCCEIFTTIRGGSVIDAVKFSPWLRNACSTDEASARTSDINAASLALAALMTHSKARACKNLAPDWPVCSAGTEIWLAFTPVIAVSALVSCSSVTASLREMPTTVSKPMLVT